MPAEQVRPFFEGSRAVADRTCLVVRLTPWPSEMWLTRFRRIVAEDQPLWCDDFSTVSKDQMELLFPLKTGKANVLMESCVEALVEMANLGDARNGQDS